MMKQHVFISYSRKNSDFAQKLIADLGEASIPYWIDLKGISHHDPSFDRSIREAMNTAFAVLLIATPESQESDYVQGEIDIALERNIPLIVVWASGEFYTDCVPTRLSRRSYVDCREERYSSVKNQFINELIELRNTAIPEMTLSNGTVPSCCFTIRLPNQQRLIVRSDAYSRFIDLLMDLYNSYLSETFPAFTYGQSWVLVLGNGPYKIALAPVEMFSKQDKSWYDVNLESFMLKAGANVRVASLQDASLFGLVVPSRERMLLESLYSNRDVTGSRIAKYLHNGLEDTEIPLSQLANLESEYQKVFVMYTPDRQYNGRVFVIPH